MKTELEKIEQLINTLKKKLCELDIEFSKDILEEEDYYEFPFFMEYGDYSYDKYYIQSIKNGEVYGVEVESSNDFHTNIYNMSYDEIIILCEYVESYHA